MWTVLFDDAEGQKTRALGTVNALAKIGGGELFPVSRKLGGRSRLSESSLRETKGYAD